jgi:Asp-tRNA(Asn)/Glu-tRNA(Gln) amidotransferase A subunit family amidase
LLVRLARRDYDIDGLLALTAGSLPALNFDHTPLAATSARQWKSAEYAPPEGAPGRVTVAALRAEYEAGRRRPSEVLASLRAVVERAEFGNVDASPYISLDWDVAQQAAEDSDARWRAGATLGPLDGIPVPVKDEVDMVGLATRGGTAWHNAIAETDAFAVRALRAGGAIVYGKTHTTEWGMSPVGINPHYKMPRNAWLPGFAAGGSSTGTGAALALQHAPVGLGSDGGGSIRIPACLQGLFGLKPTFGRIGRGGDVFGCGSVSVLGPLGQSTADLVALLSVAAARPDPGDASCAATPVATPIPSWQMALGRGVKKARIGVPRRYWERATPEIQARCSEALDALEAEGAKLIDIDLPMLQHAHAIGVLAIGPETLVGLRDLTPQQRAQCGGELELQLLILGAISAEEFLWAQRARQALRQELRKAYGRLDLIAMPTVATTAPRYPVKEHGKHVADDQAVRDMCAFAFPANLIGYPSGTVPLGRVSGLPVGMQLMGDAWDEASVIAAMAHLERLSLTQLPLPPGAARI